MASWTEVKLSVGGKTYVNMDFAVQIRPAPPASGQPSGVTEVVMHDGEKLYSSQSASELYIAADEASRDA